MIHVLIYKFVPEPCHPVIKRLKGVSDACTLCTGCCTVVAVKGLYWGCMMLGDILLKRLSLENRCLFYY